MCGIAGLVCLGQSCATDDHVRLVAQMCELQVHRGPDDTGVVPLGDACLGANRLSIIDLSQAGHMPMATPDRRWWIAYNGEVYNFQALRDELLREGRVFQSRTDTTRLSASSGWVIHTSMLASALRDTSLLRRYQPSDGRRSL